MSARLWVAPAAVSEEAAPGAAQVVLQAVAVQGPEDEVLHPEAADPVAAEDRQARAIGMRSRSGLKGPAFIGFGAPRSNRRT